MSQEWEKRGGGWEKHVLHVTARVSQTSEINWRWKPSVVVLRNGVRLDEPVADENGEALLFPKGKLAEAKRAAFIAALEEVNG